MLKYTHNPHAENPAAECNRFRFVYRRDAALTIKEEMADMRDASQLLIYGQAKWMYMSMRYICTKTDASELAAMMLQAQYGDYSQSSFKPGYLKYFI